VITTVNGGVTMSLTSMVTDPYSQKIALTIIGLISIFAAMLTTINQYIKSAQMSEAHRISAIAYGKLHRIITNELSLRRDQRLNAMDFLKTIRGEQDRLENSSPIILSAIIEKFNARFMNSSIEKPEITGDLEQVIINRSPKDSMMNRVYTLVSSPFATKKNRGADVSPIKDENVITIADPNNR
jgi:hypothetical protein